MRIPCPVLESLPRAFPSATSVVLVVVCIDLVGGRCDDCALVGVDLHVENAGWGGNFDLVDPLAVLSPLVLGVHGLALDMLLGRRDRGGQRYPGVGDRRCVIAGALRIV